MLVVGGYHPRCRDREDRQEEEEPKGEAHEYVCSRAGVEWR